jgi:endogenous inhibitor of DNA gyrase (YacG/DUF329 family)
MPEPGALCVHCRRRPVDARFKPFCSDRCKMADLGQWLTGGYRIPVAPETVADDEDDTES